MAVAFLALLFDSHIRPRDLISQQFPRSEGVSGQVEFRGDVPRENAGGPGLAVQRPRNPEVGVPGGGGGRGGGWS